MPDNNYGKPARPLIML